MIAGGGHGEKDDVKEREREENEIFMGKGLVNFLNVRSRASLELERR